MTKEQIQRHIKASLVEQQAKLSRLRVEVESASDDSNLEVVQTLGAVLALNAIAIWTGANEINLKF